MNFRGQIRHDGRLLKGEGQEIRCSAATFIHTGSLSGIRTFRANDPSCGDGRNAARHMQIRSSHCSSLYLISDMVHHFYMG